MEFVHEIGKLSLNREWTEMDMIEFVRGIGSFDIAME